MKTPPSIPVLTSANSRGSHEHTAVLVIAGIAAFVIVKGWNRLKAALLTVVNLWLILMCSFIGIMAVSGVWL